MKYINLTLKEALERQESMIQLHGVCVNVHREKGTIRYYILPCWPGAFKRGVVT